MVGCKLLVFHPPHLDEKLGIATWISSEGEDSISDGKVLISERD
jgi:hypothetical protein